MIRTLRKRHRQLWMLWAILLPAGIVFAWLIIPNDQAVRSLKEPVNLLPQVVRSAERPDYNVMLRSNSERTAWQIEWNNKTVLELPSAVIYRIIDANKDITQQQLIGRIETKGSYVFSLPGETVVPGRMKLVVYDFIHEQRADSINL